MNAAIFVPVIVFTAIVIALSVVVLLVRARLSPAGLVTITINRHRRLQVDAGTKLLAALSDHGVLLPAACGGRGSCGQCRVHVSKGGGSILPNESALIGRRGASQGMRLACMVQLRDDLEINVPAELLEVKRYTATVRANRNIAPLLTELVLDLPQNEPLQFDAGNYVLLEAPPYDVAFADFAIDEAHLGDWRQNGLLGLRSKSEGSVTRAYSLANAPGEGDEAVLLVRIATAPPRAPAGTPPGKVSSYIFSLRPGDKVAISGPFGDFRATETEREMLMLAGGVGIAPIHSIIVDQLARGTKRRISLWYGAREQRDLCYVEVFDELARQHENFQWHAVLSDPRADGQWQGHRGFVHAVVLEQYLEAHAAPELLEYYLCGPPLMSSAVLVMLDGLGVDRDSVYFDEFGSQ